jgi:hypothetical protein
MANKRITFQIGTNGNITGTDTCGMGAGCQEATADIEKMLGQVDESSRKSTADAFVKADDLILKRELE